MVVEELGEELDEVPVEEELPPETDVEEVTGSELAVLKFKIISLRGQRIGVCTGGIYSGRSGARARDSFANRECGGVSENLVYVSDVNSIDGIVVTG